jgi:hypothetical protein
VRPRSLSVNRWLLPSSLKRPNPVGMASGRSPQIALISAVAGEIAIAQDHALRSAIPGRDLEIAYDGAVIEN